MMQIFSSSSCWKAEKTAYLKHFWSLSPLKACVWTEKKKENATPHSLTSHLQRTKRCRFHFVERMRAIFTNNNPPLKTQGGGIKLVFCLGESFIFYYFSKDRAGITCFGNTWGAKWHCWKHRLTKVTCRDCGRLLRCFCLFWHDECLVLSEIKNCVVVRCRVCPFQQGFPTFSLHCRPLTTLSWTSRLNQGFWVAQTFWYFAVSPLPPPKNLSRAPKLQKNPNGFTPIGYLQRQ